MRRTMITERRTAVSAPCESLNVTYAIWLCSVSLQVKKKIGVNDKLKELGSREMVNSLKNEPSHLDIFNITRERKEFLDITLWCPQGDIANFNSFHLLRNQQAVKSLGRRSHFKISEIPNALSILGQHLSFFETNRKSSMLDTRG